MPVYALEIITIIKRRRYLEIEAADPMTAETLARKSVTVEEEDDVVREDIWVMSLKAKEETHEQQDSDKEAADN